MQLSPRHSAHLPITPMLMAVLSLVLFTCPPLAVSAPERTQNITVILLSPTSVKVNWSAPVHDVEKYDVVYRPTKASFRVIETVAANADSVILEKLDPLTQYQVSVTAIGNSGKSRSRIVVFETMADVPPPSQPMDPASATANPNLGMLKVRGVEVTIVVVVLVVWAGAILLFFNRWGKIRMLLPYQPDYKEQHKSTCPLAAASAVNTATTTHPVLPSAAFAQHHICGASALHLECSGSPGRVHPANHHIQMRPRLNSVFIFSGMQQSPEIRVQRKTKSAEQLDMSPREEEQSTEGFLFADV